MKANLERLHPFKDLFQKYALNPAICEGQHTLTYSDLHTQAKRIAQGLSERGVASGQIVALDDLKTSEMIISIWACVLSNFIVFPINSRHPHKPKHSILESLQPAIVVSNFSNPDYSTLGFADLSATETSNTQNEWPSFDENSPASLLMTSGSSGSAKFVQHSLFNHSQSALGSNQNIALGETDRWVLNLPLYHIGGLSILFRTAFAGAAIVIPETKESTLKDIQIWGATHVSLVATQLQRFLKEPSGPHILQKMKAILLGGSAVSTKLIEDALNHQLPIHFSYGSTEMASQITTTGKNNRSAALSNSGKLLSGRDLIISHEGEILVKGDTLGQGYIKQDELIDFRDSAGWFHTGDTGYINVQGELTVTGRLDNQFISGGENIQPEHIERILASFSGILNATVVPKQDDEFGARAVAFLEIESMAFDDMEINQQLREHLPGYMIPIAYYQFPEDFSRGNLKISRRDLELLVNTENKHLQTL